MLCCVLQVAVKALSDCGVRDTILYPGAKCVELLKVVDSNHYGVRGWLCRNEHAGAFIGETQPQPRALASVNVCHLLLLLYLHLCMPLLALDCLPHAHLAATMQRQLLISAGRKIS